MALIVETGQIIAGADSYVSLADAREMAVKLGWDLPVDDGEAEIALRNGTMYIGLQEPSMCGRRVSQSQSLSYPRQGVKLFGYPVSSTTIPVQVIQAQIAAAVEYGAGSDVRANDDGRITSMERVEGAVTVQYFDNGNNGNTITITKAMDALRPLLCGNNNGFEFNVYRG